MTNADRYHQRFFLVLGGVWPHNHCMQIPAMTRCCCPR
jgi:hypothetical protein